MSALQMATDRGVASPLMSNNPFRNKIASSQTQVPPLRPARPVSTNPFLDSTEFQKESASAAPSEGINEATNLFASMTMNGPSRSPERRPRPNPNGMTGRPENMQPRSMRRPPPTHRATPSEEERRRRGMQPRRGTEMDIFADPSDSGSLRERRSTRRNSESSVRDKPNSLDPEDERRRREKKDRDPKNGRYKPSKKLDIIDKLDVTSIYGTGLFHHDGPFDACNPHRNKRKHKYAPIQAFPKDSANMMIGGGPMPEKPQMDYDRYHGYGQEAHIDYNEAAVADDYGEYFRRPLPARSASFNPTARDTVHGEETAGLGTSTFLEGAPASRLAIERRNSEMNDTQQLQPPSASGLSRKKSLAQKIRAVRNGPRVQSPDSERGPNSPLHTGKSDIVTNPFFKDYDNEYEKKGQQIAQAEEQATDGRPRALSSPRPLSSSDKQTTNENAELSQDSKSSGFLGRMKSLKKTKSRYERREAS